MSIRGRLQNWLLDTATPDGLQPERSSITRHGLQYQRSSTKARRVTLASILFRFARTRPGNSMIRWSFAHATRFMPVDRLHETDLAIAFRHSQPTHQVHVVVVPKRPIKTLMHLSGEDGDVLRDVFLTIQHVVSELGLETEGYSVIVNGGPRQDVEQIHFHVVAGADQVDHRRSFR